MPGEVLELFARRGKLEHQARIMAEEATRQGYRIAQSCTLENDGPYAVEIWFRAMQIQEEMLDEVTSIAKN